MQGFTLAAITDAEKIKLRLINEQWSVKYRSRALGQGACLKGMSRTITMQGFTLAAITDAEKNFDVKINKVIGPQNIGQGHTMQGFTLLALTDVEKTKLRRQC